MPRYRLAFERYRNTDRPLQFFQMNYRVVAGGRVAPDPERVAVGCLRHAAAGAALTLRFQVEYLQVRLSRGRRPMPRRELRGLLPVLLIAGATTGTASGQQAFVNYRRARVLSGRGPG